MLGDFFLFFVLLMHSLREGNNVFLCPVPKHLPAVTCHSWQVLVICAAYLIFWVLVADTEDRGAIGFSCCQLN